ncbi:unnamed protein product [Mesocestoides corti]|uniref:GPI mannosyltransferase 2 n=1 Tax=Mesocestoides corti TaxID=53468 RepID=A0A3P6HUJ1_MESCO|nr:unnamed protein product [Mesocestoides corti]
MDGFRKWDAVYFHFISINGYLYENTLAFFPLFSIVLRTFSSFTYVFCFSSSFRTHTILCGVCLNFLFNVLCAIQIYRLSKLSLMSDSVSIVSALLFTINPASVFFSTLYSESLYTLLLISALVYINERRYLSGCILLSLTVFCRSNGLVNIGFACFPHFILLANRFLDPSSIKQKFRVILSMAYRVIIILSIVIGVAIPYVAYQYYAYFLYCSVAPRPASLSFLMPHMPSPDLEEFARKLGVPTPYSVNSTTRPEWCEVVPWSSYTRLQKKFWNVGPFNYYEWKQIPNFLLALPVIVLVIRTVHLYGRMAFKTMVSLGLIEAHRRQRLVLPHIYHVMFLCAYGIVNVHIQVGHLSLLFPSILFEQIDLLFITPNP